MNTYIRKAILLAIATFTFICSAAPDATHKNEKWIHKTSQNHIEIIDFINSLHPSRDGIQGTMSGKDYHVWVRVGDNSDVKYTLQYPQWDNDTRQQMETLLENDFISILGIFNGHIYYIEAA